MNTLSKAITGGIFVLGGLFFVVFSFFTSMFLLIYGIPLFIIGMFILFNRSEDKIESIKSRKEKGRER